MLSKKVEVFDAEANGLLDSVSTIWTICIKPLGGEMMKFRPEEIEEGLAELNTADIIVCHNLINYDLQLFEKIAGWVIRDGVTIVDTYIMSRTLQPDRPRPRGMKGKAGPHSLEAWGYRFGRPKPVHEDWTQFSKDMLHRCSEDVEINVLTYEALCKEAGVPLDDPYQEGAVWSRALKLENISQGYINGIQNVGAPFDVKKANEHVAYLTREMVDIELEVVPQIPQTPKQKGVTVTEPFLMSGAHSKMVRDWLDEDELTEHVIGPFTRIQWHTINLGSDAQVKEYFHSIGWKPTEWNTKKVTAKEAADPSSPYYKQQAGREAKGKDGRPVLTSPKLTEDSFGSLPEGLGSNVAHYLRCRHRRSLLEGLIDNTVDGRVFQRFTGLASTGRYKHAGVVNIPGTGWFGHEMRECFTTVEGYKMVGTDAASCQLRKLAHYMNDPAYTKTVVEGVEVEEDTGLYRGTDIHTVNGMAAGLISPSIVEKFRGMHEDDIEAKYRKEYEHLNLQRRKAKNFIYGLLFGAGPAKIAATIGVSVREAKAIMKRFLTQLPALGKLMSALDRTIAKRGYLLGLDGRKIVLRSPHMKLVYLLQTAEAIFMKAAWFFLEETCKARGIDMHTIIFNHDEFQCLVPDGKVEEFCKIATESFERAGTYLKLNCPTTGHPKVGVNWSETH